MVDGRPIPPTDFEELVRSTEAAVLRYLLTRAQSATEATELAQETFVRAYCALTKGTLVERPTSWVLAIARNVLLEALRDHRYERQLAERMGRVMGMDWESPWHERVEQKLIVAGALEELPKELREPVMLHYFGGLSVSEIAGHLEISAGAVKTRLWRARQALRGELEVLMSEAEKKSVVFEVPRNLAAKAKTLAEKPPVYRSVVVAIHVGGPRWATEPMFEPLFPDSMLSWEDVRFAVTRLHAVRVSGARPLTNHLEFWPSLELFYHPKPVETWSFLRSAEIDTQGFQNSEEGRLVITDGWRLGRDDDAPHLLVDFRKAGLRHVWFTFAGLRETHDDLCQRPGAFDAVVKAMERCRDAGMETGANIIVSTRNTGEIKSLAQLIRSLGGERFISTAPFWSLRPEHGHLQPEPEDLADLPPQGLDVNWGCRDLWSDPEEFTEAAHVRRALASGKSEEGPAGPKTPHTLSLWVWPNLDLLINSSRPVPSHRVGNLRDDSPEQVYQALTDLTWPPEPPSDAELAKRYGDAESRKVFPGHLDRRNGLLSVRQKWIEAWRADQDIPWLPFPWSE